MTRALAARVDRFGWDRLRILLLRTVLGYGIVLLIVGVAACFGAGCGGAQQVSAGAACSTMNGLIAARTDYSAERSASDLDSQRSICDRLTAAPRTP